MTLVCVERSAPVAKMDPNETNKNFHVASCNENVNSFDEMNIGFEFDFKRDFTETETQVINQFDYKPNLTENETQIINEIQHLDFAPQNTTNDQTLFALSNDCYDSDDFQDYFVNLDSINASVFETESNDIDAIKQLYLPESENIEVNGEITIDETGNSSKNDQTTCETNFNWTSLINSSPQQAIEESSNHSVENANNHVAIDDSCNLYEETHDFHELQTFNISQLHGDLMQKFKLENLAQVEQNLDHQTLESFGQQQPRLSNEQTLDFQNVNQTPQLILLPFRTDDDLSAFHNRLQEKPKIVRSIIQQSNHDDKKLTFLFQLKPKKTKTPSSNNQTMDAQLAAIEQDKSHSLGQCQHPKPRNRKQMIVLDLPSTTFQTVLTENVIVKQSKRKSVEKTNLKRKSKEKKSSPRKSALKMQVINQQVNLTEIPRRSLRIVAKNIN